LSKSGFASGFSGMAVPLMAMAMPVPQAAAILLPLLMVMDATGLQQLWRERDRDLVRRLVPAGLLGIVAGTLLFGLLSAKAVAGVVGAMTLALPGAAHCCSPAPDAPPLPRWVGRICAVVSGFTSFVAHAGGPPIRPTCCRMRMTPRCSAPRWRCSSQPSMPPRCCPMRAWA
jgi:uncharacterized membrane protein YfcA